MSNPEKRDAEEPFGEQLRQSFNISVTAREKLEYTLEILNERFGRAVPAIETDLATSAQKVKIVLEASDNIERGFVEANINGDLPVQAEFEMGIYSKFYLMEKSFVERMTRCPNYVEFFRTCFELDVDVKLIAMPTSGDGDRLIIIVDSSQYYGESAHHNPQTKIYYPDLDEDISEYEDDIEFVEEKEPAHIIKRDPGFSLE